MKHIDPNSVDEWLFNHFEGNLNFDEQSQLMDFLEANPQFKEDLDLWSDLKIEEPVAEFPGMESLLVEESEPIVELVLAGTGAAATTGAAAWFKWGAGVAATVLIGVLAVLNWDATYEPGYQPTAKIEDAISESAGLFADGTLKSYDGATATTNTTNGNLSEPDIFDGEKAKSTSIPSINTNRQAAVLANNVPSIANTNTLKSDEEAENLATDTPVHATVVGSSDINNDGAVTNQALLSHTNSDNKSLVISSSNENTITDVSNASVPNDKNASEGTLVDETNKAIADNRDPSATTELLNREASDEAKTRNQAVAKNTVSSDWVEGSFNDPDWAHKFLATPADENGDGRWDNNHKHAPSFKNLPSTGVWPFKVPYNGVGFTNEQRSPKFIIPEAVLLNISPALAGNSGQGIYHAQVNARRQAMGTDNLQNRFMAAVDYQFEAINGALGVVASQQSFTNDNYEAFSVAGVYAHKIELSKKVELSPALRVGYTKQTYGPTQDRATVIETTPGTLVTLKPSGEVHREQSYLDYAAGFHLNAEKWFGGAAVDHISEPSQNVIHTDLVDKKLERAYTAYLGTEFKPRRESDFVYSPTLLYKSQGEMNELWVSNTLTYKWAQVGIGVSTEQGAKASFGWNANDGRLNIRYGIDLTPSSIQSDNYTSQELTVGLLLN